MKNKIISVNDYRISADDNFFFDNNIWMFLHCPIGNYKREKQNIYSKFYGYVLQRKNPIYINSLMLSEFANTYLRLDFNKENDKSKPFKKFELFKKNYLGSEESINTIKSINNEMAKILTKCTKCSDEFNSIDLPAVLNLFTSIGFNDSYYAYLAHKKKWIIVSDDSDFSNGKIPDLGLTILTDIR